MVSDARYYGGGGEGENEENWKEEDEDEGQLAVKRKIGRRRKNKEGEGEESTETHQSSSALCASLYASLCAHHVPRADPQCLNPSVESFIDSIHPHLVSSCLSAPSASSPFFLLFCGNDHIREGLQRA